MGTFSIWHWLIVLVIILVLFGGRGKISQLMGDLGRGLKSFKRNMKEDESFDEQTAGPAPSIEPKTLPPEAARAAETAAAERDRAAQR